jgi:hypothetical protein
MKTTNLFDLLDRAEISRIKTLLQVNDEKGLRDYLNEAERKERLKNKGVLAEYLFYVILHNKSNILKLPL